MSFVKSPYTNLLITSFPIPQKKKMNNDSNFFPGLEKIASFDSLDYFQRFISFYYFIIPDAWKL